MSCRGYYPPPYTGPSPAELLSSEVIEEIRKFKDLDDWSYASKIYEILKKQKLPIHGDFIKAVADFVSTWYPMFHYGFVD
jgi:hypothetical protein